MTQSVNLDWQGYVPSTYQHTDFNPASRVVDIGCGQGIQLRELARRGCRAVGVEVSATQAARISTGGMPVLVARGESLPFRDGAFDAAVSKGVLMFTEEDDAIREIARLVRVGGEVDLMVNGIGYYLRYLVCGPSLKLRFYGLRTLLNTWVLVGAGRRLPGFLGDTAYDSKRRILRLCLSRGLAIVRHAKSPTFLGLPVFVYLRLQRV